MTPPVDLSSLPIAETIIEPDPARRRSVRVRECRRSEAGVPYYLELSIDEDHLKPLLEAKRKTPRPELDRRIKAHDVLAWLDTELGRELTPAELREVVLEYARPILDRFWRWFEPTRPDGSR